MQEVKIVYDCQTCGACCHWKDNIKTRRWIIQVHETDTQVPQELTEPNDMMHEEHDYPRVMRQKNQRRCVAFRGTVGRKNSCSIYANRPTTCRNFEVGSVWCRNARKAAGLPINSPEFADEPE